MSNKFQSNEVSNETLENIEIVQYLEAQNVQKYFDYKIEKPKPNSFQTIELLKKKQNSLSERLNKMFQNGEDSSRTLPLQSKENVQNTFTDLLSCNPKIKSQNKQHQDSSTKVDVLPNSYHIDYNNNSGFKLSPLKQSTKINVMSSSKQKQQQPQQTPSTAKKENISCDDSQYQVDQSKENKYSLHSERLSQKVSYLQGSSSKDQKGNQKSLFNNRYNNLQQVLTIILEVPSGVDKIIIENEDEVPDKAKNFCIKHNYSLECVPQLIESINLQINALTQNSNNQESNNSKASLENSSNSINGTNTKSNQPYQLPSFSDSIFNKSLQNNSNNSNNNNKENPATVKEPNTLNNQASNIAAAPKQISPQNEKSNTLQTKENSQNIERNNKFNGNNQINEKKQNKDHSQKKFYNIYDSHEEALSELYNKKQKELQSYFQVDIKKNKSVQQDSFINKNQSLNESSQCIQSQSSKKTTKKWQRDGSCSPVPFSQFQPTTQNASNNQTNSQQGEQKRSISPLLSDQNQFQNAGERMESQNMNIGANGSPVKVLRSDASLGNLLKKENSTSNLMKNMRDQVKLQKAESSANLNKQQDQKIQNLIESNAQQNIKKNEQTKQENSEKTDNIFLTNSPISHQKGLYNNTVHDSNHKMSISNSMAYQFSQNSSCSEMFSNNPQGIKKSSSALFINKNQIQPIEEVVQKPKNDEDGKKKRSLSPFVGNSSNINGQSIINKSYYKNTVSQQNKVLDKSKDPKNRSRSPLQTMKQDRSVSNPRKKSIENTSSTNISKPKLITASPLNKEKSKEHSDNHLKKEIKTITTIKNNFMKTPTKEKSPLQRTPIKDTHTNNTHSKSAATMNQQAHSKTNNHNNDENENNFQPQISEQSKKLAVASRQKGVAIHERLYNEAKKELKKKEQWDVQLKKILNKNSTPNQKTKENNSMAYFQLKSIHQNGKTTTKPKDYVIYQNNNSPFIPKEPADFGKSKKREVSSERDEKKVSTSSSSQKFNKSSSSSLLFQNTQNKDIMNSENKNPIHLNNSKNGNKQEAMKQNEIIENPLESQVDHDSLVKQQQELLSFYENSINSSMSSQKHKEKSNISSHNVCKTVEDKISHSLNSQNLQNMGQEKVLKTLPEGLIFQKKGVQQEREPLKVSPRYLTYDNQETEEDLANKKLKGFAESQNSSIRMSDIDQHPSQNRLETQLFQNQLKQLQLQEEMMSQYKEKNEMLSIENIYHSLSQNNNSFDPSRVHSNQSHSQVKKTDYGEEKVRKVLEYIFFALDSDSDGQISTENIDLSKLNSTILILIQDVLIDVENLRGFVDFNCFYSLARRRGIENSLVEYVFNENSPQHNQEKEEDKQKVDTTATVLPSSSNYASSYLSKSSNGNRCSAPNNPDYFNEFEKQAMEYFGKPKPNNHNNHNHIRLSGALLTNESLTPDLFYQKKQEYFDMKEYENKLQELQKKSHSYDIKIENKEDPQTQRGSRYQAVDEEEKYKHHNASPAFGNDSIFSIQN